MTGNEIAQKWFNEDYEGQWRDGLATEIDAAIAQHAFNARVEERKRWTTIIERMAESRIGSVQAALWGLAEMIQRDVEHVNVGTN